VIPVKQIYAPLIHFLHNKQTNKQTTTTTKAKRLAQYCKSKHECYDISLQNMDDMDD